ncbi:MAG: SMC-Scp complex subunit ScpB [Firmicutes bacterium]|nr:SMC-Scp complex subunit ScpB [Bacillota bacterium]
MSLHRRLLEALLFLRAEPVSLEEIQRWLRVTEKEAALLVDELGQYLRDRDSGLTLQWVDGGVRLVTHPSLADDLQAALTDTRPEPLSHASWEVLAIVAYKQPITRMEIEAIRQTNSERAIETLVTRQLIEEVGRKEVPGRPILYGTTARFLRQFGLRSLEDLPPLSEAPSGSTD